ncbi:MAG: hypothetical protein KKE50_05085 [Nanoarchaeota archaeon]|nr:hypothetical protein [Nanoarchaeota archaeon]
MNKRGFEFSFAWLFAIIVGIFILFAAIYIVIKVVGTEHATVNTVCAKQFSLLFNPMETGLASGKSTNVSISIETRIYTSCSELGSFGSQEIACSQKSGFKDEWPAKSGGILVNNKYVFSDKIEQGKTFYFFSKPFEMPFKVSELIFLSAKTYCFYDAPSSISEEVRDLGVASIKLGNCTNEDVKVCFGNSGAGCDISVFGSCTGLGCESEYDSGRVRKDGKTVYYAGSLIYAGIFSDPDNYLCNLRRLMQRVQNIARLYDEEQAFLSTRGCGTAMSSSLIGLAQAASAADGTTQTGIDNVIEAAARVDGENSRQRGCKIYGI